MRFITLTLFLFFTGHLYCQQILVADSASQSPVQAVHIISADSAHYTVTGEDGKFSLNLFKNTDHIIFSHIAYKTLSMSYSEVINRKIILLSPALIPQPEVVVEKEKSSSSNAASEIIGVTSLLSDTYTNMGDILQRKSSLYIKDFGGPAGAKTITVRGMSSENTIVLFNEARINDINTGLLDLSSISSRSVSRINFYKNSDETGMYSSAGGILKIFSNDKFTGTKADIGLRLSTDNYKAGTAFYSGGNENVYYNLNFERGYSRNNFNYIFRENNLERENSHFNKTSVDGNLVLNFSRFYLNFYNGYNYLNSGIPGFVVSNNFNSSTATNSSRKFLSILNSAYSVSPAINISSVISLNRQFLKINDPEGFIISESKESRLNDFAAIIKGNFVFSFAEFTLSNEYTYSSLSQQTAFISSANAPDAIKRSSDKISAGTKIPVATNAVFPEKVNLYSGLMYEFTSENAGSTKYSDNLSYNTGILLSSGDNNSISVRLQYYKTFRLPTFNERYYANLYNHYELNNESYSGFDAGIETKFNWIGTAAASFTYYRIEGKNKIIWIPTRLALQTPRNIARVLSSGVEINLNQFLFENKIELSCFYVYTSAKNKSQFSENDLSFNKQLIYTPLHRLNFSVTGTFNSFTLGIFSSLNSESFYTADNSNAYRLASYAVFDLSVGYKFQLFNHEVSLSTAVYNILNEEYYIIQSYPMPLRSFLFTLNMELL